jgi:hypothetical protein
VTGFRRCRHPLSPNAACLANQPRGYLVLGVDDATHELVGARFDSHAVKDKGNQDLLPWLATGEAGRHIRERGFDRQYYLDLILALVREHAPVDRREVDQLLLPKLPDRLTQEQKRRKVHNLLQELRRTGRIENLGSRTRPKWVPGSPTAEE